jgi:2-desacetyl-2-hydroxyethyl bacteriochlorophyllide A dehydrogenase
MNKKIVFTGPWQVELQHSPLASVTLVGNQVLVKKRYSLISPGTELACLSGGESWFPMPGIPGYAAVSEIIDIGPDVREFQVGDIVFHYGNHTQFECTTTDGVFMKVPAEIELAWVPFVRMATVAMTSLRVSDIQVGDLVAVTGLGLIGNMAAQLASLQGAEVIGVDIADHRLAIAKSCGISHTVVSHAHMRQDIMRLTQNRGVSTLIDATGVPKVLIDAVSWIAKKGEAILLGSPRGEHQANITDLLNYIHLDGFGTITFKGAHEWRYPVTPDPFVKHSMVRNSEIVFNLMLQRKLQIVPLISHILAPEEATSAYEGLRNRKDDYLGVLFRWS